MSYQPHIIHKLMVSMKGLIKHYRALIKMIEENQSEWDKLFDSVLFAYRTSKQASTQFSPFFLLYGREPRLPIELSISKMV